MVYPASELSPSRSLAGMRSRWDVRTLHGVENGHARTLGRFAPCDARRNPSGSRESSGALLGKWRHNGGVTDGWRVLSLDHRDPVAPLEEIVHLIDLAGLSTAVPYGRSDVVEALNERQPAVVAISSEGGGRTLVGAAVARAAGRDAHLLALALHPDWRNRGIGSADPPRAGPTGDSCRRLSTFGTGESGPGGRARVRQSGFRSHRRIAVVHAMHRWCLRNSPSWRSTAAMFRWPDSGMR